MIMLKITHLGVAARFNNDSMQWVSKDENIAFMLNQTIPEEIHQVDAGFRIGGWQAIALRGAKEQFGDSIVVIKQTESPLPPDIDGVDYSVAESAEAQNGIET